ncbi:hypothetical protein PI124_g20375 [Phytophthora idaei]|nr:hypothetical protein PI124_g20375 [Phytophthora idaei]
MDGDKNGECSDSQGPRRLARQTRESGACVVAQLPTVTHNAASTVNNEEDTDNQQTVANQEATVLQGAVSSQVSVTIQMAIASENAVTCQATATDLWLRSPENVEHRTAPRTRETGSNRGRQANIKASSKIWKRQQTPA